MIAAIGVIVATRVASAESEADRLFTEGYDDLEHGDFDAGCPKLARSYELKPTRQGGGMAANLARCEEHYGHLARAWRLWNDAVLLWQQSPNPKGLQIAQEGVRRVAEKATTVVIGVPDPDAPGLAITVNGERVAAAKTIRTVVDPGNVEVVASARGAATFRRTRTGSAGETVVVEVRLGATGTGDGVVTERRRSRVYAAWGLGAGAAAAGIAGLSFALVGRSDFNAAVTEDCNGDVDACSPDGVRRVNAARRLGNIGTGFGIAAGALAATAVIVYMTAPRDVVIAPAAAPGAIGVVFAKRF